MVEQTLQLKLLGDLKVKTVRRSVVVKEVEDLVEVREQL